MILMSVETEHGARLAAKLPAGVLVLEDVASLLDGRNDGSLPKSLDEVIRTDNGLVRLSHLLAESENQPHVHSLVRRPEDVIVALPFHPDNVICVGLNYRFHAEEGGREIPKEPMVFAKWTTCLIAAGQPIVLTGDSLEVDYEAELAVVIGRTCRSVAAADALHYVAGYTCLNDVSARDFQRADKQWSRAKSQDTFGPMGPYLVTADEIPDPQSLNIRCVLNGTVMQDSNTREMIFPVPELIAFLSRGMTLRPGDVISTGTPHGVGFARNPPVFLKNGDIVSVEIEKIGVLQSPIRADL